MEDKGAVLVVEDAPQLRELLCEELAFAGFDVRGCKNGAAALAASEKKAFQTIIADYSMPDMNGADVAKRLRERFPAAIIIGISLNDRKRAFLTAGADFFLQKPFAYNELLQLMKAG
jgi:DNA-binding response OmpR family regulator